MNHECTVFGTQTIKTMKENHHIHNSWHSSQPHMEKVEMLQLTVSSTDTPWKLKGKQKNRSCTKLI